jgi:PTS system nitrogen regulatory IIA component
MNLDAVFGGQHSIERLAGTTREQVFGEVAAALARAGAMEAALSDEICAAFMERENRGTTAFGFGLALPHVFHPSFKCIHLLVALHPSGVDFGALDGDPTKVLLCLAGPESERANYLKALSFLAGTMRNPSWRRFVASATDTAAVREVLAEAAQEA